MVLFGVFQTFFCTYIKLHNGFDKKDSYHAGFHDAVIELALTASAGLSNAMG